MFKSLVLAGATAVAICMANGVSATTISFNSSQVGSADNLIVGDYRFTYFYADHANVANVGGRYALTDGNNQNFSGANLFLDRVDGRAFNFLSFDYADPSGNVDQIRLNEQTFVPLFSRVSSDYATVVTDLTNITRLHIDELSAINAPGLGMTNFVVTTVAAVPESSSWAMFIGGFGILGALIRRRRTKIRFASTAAATAAPANKLI